MALDNNPLKQYFRRPALHLRLPSGGQGYGPGIINLPDTGELPIYPMTAIDEITAKTPDALFNGSAVSELIKSCVPNIIDPWAVSSYDLDAVLIAIKAASQGSELEIDSQCPSCEEVASYGVNLMGILATMKPGDYTKELNVGELSIKFRPLQYREMNEASLGQFELQKMLFAISKIEDETEKAKQGQEAVKTVTEITMKILAKTIEYIKTPGTTVTETSFIVDFLKSCDNNMFVAIRDYHAKLKESTEIKPLKIKCIHCQNEYEQAFTLNASDFFG